MRALSGLTLMLVMAAAAAAQEAKPAPAPTAGESIAPGPNEVLLFEDRRFQGKILTLKTGVAIPDLSVSSYGNWDRRISSLWVGDDAVAVLYTGLNYTHTCVVLPGKGGGAPGVYPDLGRIASKNLRGSLDNTVGSLRIVEKGADTKKLCE
jgi:hypothetical protein